MYLLLTIYFWPTPARSLSSPPRPWFARVSQAEAGLGLTELSVCDLALRNLVRATELQELQQVWKLEIYRS